MKGEPGRMRLGIDAFRLSWFVVAPAASALAIYGAAGLPRAISPHQPTPAVARYREWRVVNPTRFFVPDRVAVLCSSAATAQAMKNPSPHTGKYIRVYVNSSASRAMFATSRAVFPVGSTIVKEKYATDKIETPEIATVMIKRERGFAPSDGDWEYAVLDTSLGKVIEDGHLTRCQSCHARAKSFDYVFGTYRRGAAHREAEVFGIH